MHDTACIGHLHNNLLVPQCETHTNIRMIGTVTSAPVVGGLNRDNKG